MVEMPMSTRESVTTAKYFDGNHPATRLSTLEFNAVPRDDAVQRGEAMQRYITTYVAYANTHRSY